MNNQDQRPPQQPPQQPSVPPPNQQLPPAPQFPPPPNQQPSVQYQYGYQVHQHMQPEKQGNGLAVAGLILGIVACVFAFIPVLGAPMAILLVLIGIPMSAVSLNKSSKEGGTGKGVAVAGLVLQIAAVAIMVIWGVIIAQGISEGVKEASEQSSKGSSATESGQEETDKQTENTLQGFNADNKPQAMKIIIGELDSAELNDEFYYQPSTPNTCKYHLTNNPIQRTLVDDTDDWTDYTGTITIGGVLGTHLLADGCGQWERVDSL